MSKQVLVQHLEKANYINREINARNIPSGPINMNFFPQQVSTKYEKFYTQDNSKVSSEKIKYYGIFYRKD